MRNALLLLASVQLAAAQCSMCRTAAAAQAEQSAALNSGIVILFVPALLLFGAIVVLTIRSAGAAWIESTDMSVATAEQMTEWLQNFMAREGAVSGTVHLNDGGTLKLASAVNIPDKVREIVAIVPNGKGMAGLALQNGEPVHTCNLKEDTSGSVKPGAKAVDAQAAVAIPVRDDSGFVRAVVGIAFQEERQWTQDELHRLTSAVSGLPRGL
jgi:L-methionine (R)-S-oxide reductase